MTLPCPLALTVHDAMKTTPRECDVEIHEVREGETPYLYSHGIPVVPNDSRWHYNVQQKVPVPFDRDNVPPSYLRKLHVACVNQMHEFLTPVDTTATFVKTAVENPQCKPEAVASWKQQKYGDKAVIFDPSDPEANKRAVAEGYKVIYGGQESAGTFANIKRDELVLPAGQVTPSDKPFSKDGKPLTLLTKVSDDMRRVEAFAIFLARRLLGPKPLVVLFANNAQWGYGAVFSRGETANTLYFNVGSLGYKWFSRPPAETPEILELIIHELSHQGESDHLSANFYHELGRLASETAVWMLTRPEQFAPFRDKDCTMG